MKGHIKSSECIVKDMHNENVEDMLDVSNSFSPLESLESELDSQKDCNLEIARPKPSNNPKDVSDTVEHPHDIKGKNETPQLVQKSDKPPKPIRSNIPKIRRGNKNMDNNQHHSPSKGHPAGHIAGKK